MRFRRAQQRYGRTPEPATPYQRAGQVWDERLGSARVQARSWRFMALGELLLLAGLAGGLLWQSMQSRVVPYVVEVDETGATRAVAPALSDYLPTDPQLTWHLGRFITNVRSVSLDPVVMRENWLSAYDFVTDRGGRFLDQYARTANPFAEVGSRTVSVQVTSIVRASDRSFQVKWSETEFDRGDIVSTTRWTGILTVEVRPPSSADAIRKNPLGLFIDGIDWSREIEADLAPLARTAPARQPSLPNGSPLDPALAAPAAQRPNPEETDR